MLSREEFKTAIEKIKTQYEKINRMIDVFYNFKVDISECAFTPVETAIDVLKIAMRDKYDYIGLYIYDRDFGYWNGVGDTPEDNLYDDLIAANTEKEGVSA